VCVWFWVLKRHSNLYPCYKWKQWERAHTHTHTHTLLLLSASPHYGSSTIPRNCPPSRTHMHTHTHTQIHTHYRFLSAVCLSEHSTFYTCVNLCLHCVWTKCRGTMVGHGECGMALCVCVCVCVSVHCWWLNTHTHTHTHTHRGDVCLLFCEPVCLLFVFVFLRRQNAPSAAFWWSVRQLKKTSVTSICSSCVVKLMKVFS